MFHSLVIQILKHLLRDQLPPCPQMLRPAPGSFRKCGVSLRPQPRKRLTDRKYETKRTREKEESAYARPAYYNKFLRVPVVDVVAQLSVPCRCPNNCTSVLTLEDVAECRRKNYNLSSSGLTALLADLFWGFARRHEQLEFHHAGRPICRTKFCFIWGIGKDKLKSAVNMWRNGLVANCHGLLGSLRKDTMTDWVYNVLLEYLRNEAEKIAGHCLF